ncbi:MAG: hypothetical protein DME75_10185 [Verrucomicrobia bacterium]|nr:MAG: hypothetical protein DME75_10185 [Verrucomicrobiota bacterium]
MSKGLRLFGHPLHMMLVHFPIALWSVSLLGDVAWLWRGETLWAEMAFWSIGAAGWRTGGARGIATYDRDAGRSGSVYGKSGRARRAHSGNSAADDRGDVRFGKRFGTTGIRRMAWRRIGAAAWDRARRFAKRKPR